MLAYFLIMTSILLIVYAFYQWLTLHDHYFLKRGIPHLKPTFAVGNTAPFYFRQCRPNDYLLNLNKKFPGYKVFGMFDFRTPFYFIRDAEIIKQLTVKHFDHFVNRRLLVDNSDDIIWGKSLPFLKSERWRQMRGSLNPALSGSKIHRMFEMTTAPGTQFIEFIKNEAKSSHNVFDVEMSKWFSAFSMDAIASIAFGCKINSFEDDTNNFYKYGKKLINMASIKFGLKVVGIRLVPSLFKMFGVTMSDSSATTFFKKIIIDNILTREREGIFRPDLIHLLMKVRKENALANLDKENQRSDAVLKLQWTDEELIAQCLVFIVAGHETTFNTLSFLTHELAVNPDIQERLYKEVCEVQKTLNGEPLSYEVLQNMKYMDMVVRETLRRWPAIPMVDRICVKEYEYNDGETKITFEKGIAFWIPIYSLHHDETYWKNPNKFDPERFNDENKCSIPQGAYIPFGNGQRQCIGTRLALMEIKLAIYLLLWHFKIEPNDNTQIPIKAAKQPVGLSPERGVHVRLTSRK